MIRKQNKTQEQYRKQQVLYCKQVPKTGGGSATKRQIHRRLVTHRHPLTNSLILLCSGQQTGILISTRPKNAAMFSNIIQYMVPHNHLLSSLQVGSLSALHPTNPYMQCLIFNYVRFWAGRFGCPISLRLHYSNICSRNLSRLSFVSSFRKTAFPPTVSLQQGFFFFYYKCIHCSA